MECCPCGRPDASLKFEEGGEGESRGYNRNLRMLLFFSKRRDADFQLTNCN